MLLSLSACDVPNFGFPDGITNQTPRILNIWKGSFIAAAIVGIFVWGLIGYAVIAFRKRSDELPRQIRYNLPVEILYTAVPLVIVAGLFYYTARDEIQINKLSKHPAMTVDVIGFRWNWQFRYLDTGQNGKPPIEVTGQPGEPATLVLPEGRSIRFVETSPDVIHSWWVPEFLFKRDVIPGRVNQFEVTINKTGTFIGRCAELCGVDHDQMNFYVKVVPGPEYDSYISKLESTPATSATTVAAAAATSTTGSGT
jgi:cytochrome c oxidase subunit 2